MRALIMVPALLLTSAQSAVAAPSWGLDFMGGIAFQSSERGGHFAVDGRGNRLGIHPHFDVLATGVDETHWYRMHAGASIGVPLGRWAHITLVELGMRAELFDDDARFRLDGQTVEQSGTYFGGYARTSLAMRVTPVSRVVVGARYVDIDSRTGVNATFAFEYDVFPEALGVRLAYTAASRAIEPEDVIVVGIHIPLR